MFLTFGSNVISASNAMCVCTICSLLCLSAGRQYSITASKRSSMSTAELFEMDKNVFAMTTRFSLRRSLSVRFFTLIATQKQA